MRKGACLAGGKGFCDKTKRTMSKEIRKDKGCTDRFGMESDIDRGIKIEKNRFGVESEAVASKRKNRGKIFETNSVDRKGGFDIIIGYSLRRSGVKAINKKER